MTKTFRVRLNGHEETEKEYEYILDFLDDVPEYELTRKKFTLKGFSIETIEQLANQTWQGMTCQPIYQENAIKFEVEGDLFFKLLGHSLIIYRRSWKPEIKIMDLNKE